MKRLLIIPLVCAAIVGGCAFERHLLRDPERNQVIKVESGDNWYFRLKEPEGFIWESECSDPDVAIEIKHQYEVNTAKVRVHIHRGYDGPSTIHFTLKNRSDYREIKSFNLGLFRQTGDEAFWK